MTPITTHRDAEGRFVALLARNRGRIERICHSWTARAVDADDLRAEIHLQLWRALPSFDGRASEDTWLFRVALNTALLSARRRRRRPRETAAAEAPHMPAVPPAAHRRLVEEERRALLVAAVRRLPPVDRALVTLWLEEQPYRRIAEVTGLSESNVGARLSRARRRLAALVAAADNEEAERG